MKLAEDAGRRGIDKREIEFLDGMLVFLYPKAAQGDPESVDRVLKILELRLKYRRQRLAEED